MAEQRPADIVHLVVDGVSATFRVTAMHGRERLHAPFAFELTCTLDDAEIGDILDGLVTRAATVSWGVDEGGERSIQGLVDGVETLEASLRLRVVPTAALLDDDRDHQVFLDQDAVEIAKAVLGEHGLTLDSRVKRSLPKRAQCVQAFESDLAFVSRLFAEDGLVYYLPLDAPDTLVLSEREAGFDDLPGLSSLPVQEAGGLESAESVSQARVRRAVVPGKITLRDYDFVKPTLDQAASASAPSGGSLELYEYPGGYTDPAVGNELARLRLEASRARRVVLEAQTTCRRLSPGYVLTLDGAAVDAVNGRWLLLEVEHVVAEQRGTGEAYLARFTAVPAADGYRPPRVAAPKLGGVQTTTVTGPSGQDIHPDEHGRIKVQLRWDRRRGRDEKSSAWVRTVQPPTSGGMFLPRTGWEELTAFYGGSGDAPVALGRLYNGQAPPPSGLPGNKVVSSFGSQTTPGGGSANHVTMNDAAGSEKMSFNASKDWNERTENDKVTGVHADDSHTIGAARKLIVGQVHELVVEGAQSYSVGGSRSANVTANKSIIAASETVMIGGLRTFNVGGDYTTTAATLTRLVGGAKTEVAIELQNRVVTGASTVLVGGSWKTVAAANFAVQVLGASTELVAGAKKITTPKYALNVRGVYAETLASRKVKAGGDRHEKFGAAASYKIGGSSSIKGTDVVVEATAKLTLKASGITVTLTPGKVTIDGKYKGSGASADSGKEDYD